MRLLGISSYGHIFEGDSEYGAHLVWPRPMVTLAKFVQLGSEDERLIGASENDPFHLCFREDSFDPVSRIRRGRIYKSTGGTSDWNVIEPQNVTIPGTHNISGMVSVNTRGYATYNLSGKPEEIPELVLLGSGSVFTEWSVVDVETIATREVLLTLRARHSLGALPEIYWGKVPADHQHKVRETLETLADDYRRAGPESVIDRAREAATAILSAYLQNAGDASASGKDLAELVKKLEASKKPNEGRILACAAEIPQRLHSRGKHAEKEKRENMRPIRVQDTELAVQCVGTMLCELRWADWK